MYNNVSIVVAMADNSVIGRNNTIPWNVPTDMKRFRELTTGGTVIMGRKTYESIGQALPDRENIVVSSKLRSNQVKVVPSVEEGINLATKENIFLIGGRGIYEEGLELAAVMYLTVIHEPFAGDVTFPDFNEADWEVAESVAVNDIKSSLDCTFLTLVRHDESSIE